MKTSATGRRVELEKTLVDVRKSNIGFFLYSALADRAFGFQAVSVRLFADLQLFRL